jgi:Spy/CpxP family protein refolding chaperone
MRTTLLAALLAFAVAVLSPASGAASSAGEATDLQALRAAVTKDKRGYVASTLSLTDAEAKKFWPIYDNYQRALEVVDRRRARAVIDLAGSDRPLSDAYAKNLSTELMSTDEAEIRARRTMQNRLMRALPPRKAARYLQLESKIRAIEAYDVAASLPLVK